jgi:photosystem II stability/assembly factor-like uncharacterized protein
MPPRPCLRTLSLAALVFALSVGASNPLFAAVDRWTPLGPDGGRATSFAAAAGRAIVAAADGAGLFRSTDGGRSWAQVAAIEPGETFHFVRAAGVEGTRLWAASARSLYRSDDGGRSFVKATPGFVAPYDILGVATTRIDRDRIYVATAYGEASWLFGSRDGGRSWQRLHRTNHIFGLAEAPSNPDVVYVAELHKALRSNDGGRTLTPLAPLPFDDYLIPGVIHVDEANPDQVIFGLFSGRLAISSDGGQSLKLVDPPASPGCTLAGLSVSPESRSRWLLALSCFAGGYGLSSDPHFEKFAGQIWRTEDAGVHWAGPAETDDPAGFGAVPGAPGGVLLGASRVGVLRSDDFGRTFRISNRGLAAAPVCSLAADRERAGALFAGAGLCSPWGNFEDEVGDLGFFRLEDGKLARAVSGLRDPKTPLSAIEAVQDPEDPSRWFALPGPAIAESETQGRRWSFFPSNPPFTVVTGLAILAGTPQAPRTIFASGWSEYLHHLQAHSVVRSDDDGRTWTRIPEIQTTFEGYLAPIVTPAAPDTLIVSTTIGRLLLSHDHGVTWSSASVYPPNALRGVTGVFADPTVASRLLALSSPDNQGIATSVRRSTDGGIAWQKSNRGLPAPIKIRALAFDPERTGLVYLGTSRGVFLSEDGGANWRPLPAPGLAGRLVLTLAVDRVDPRNLYAGVAGGGGLYTLTRTDR